MWHLFMFELLWAHAKGLSGKRRPSQDFVREIYEPGRWVGSGHIYFIDCIARDSRAFLKRIPLKSVGLMDCSQLVRQIMK